MPGTGCMAAFIPTHILQDHSESRERRSFPSCGPKGQRSQYPPRTAKNLGSLDQWRSVWSICPGRPSFPGAVGVSWTHPASALLDTCFLLSSTSGAPWLVGSCSLPPNSPLRRKAAPASPQPPHSALLSPRGFLPQTVTLAGSTICFHGYGLILSPR